MQQGLTKEDWRSIFTFGRACGWVEIQTTPKRSSEIWDKIVGLACMAFFAGFALGVIVATQYMQLPP